jgi:anti-sigma B factor antagonist
VSSVRALGLEVGVDYDDGRTVLSLIGDVDVYSVTVLREQLLALAAAGHHRIALDLAGLTFMDSSGLGVLVGAVKRAEAGGGGLGLIAVPEHTLRVLRITGLAKVMPTFAARDEALVWLDAQ